MGSADHFVVSIDNNIWELHTTLITKSTYALLESKGQPLQNIIYYQLVFKIITPH